MDIKFEKDEFKFNVRSSCIIIESLEQIKTLDDGWDKFKIVEIKNIDNYDIKPKTIKKLIEENSYNDISHNINYDWGE